MQNNYEQYNTDNQYVHSNQNQNQNLNMNNMYPPQTDKNDKIIVFIIIFGIVIAGFLSTGFFSCSSIPLLYSIPLL